MYTAPNATPTAMSGTGPMAWARGAERWLDDRGRKAWIIAMILGFIFAWPIGLGLLAYMIWSKRMFNRSCAKHSSDHGAPWARHSHHWGHSGPFRSSGNTAFDAYKADTIRRLQDEQDAFEAFLQRLRDAKDKSEFDSFMEDRAKQNAAAPVTPAPGDTLRAGEY
jgi:hypothetical protein